MNSLALSELNGLVRQALELTMPDTFWVRAEISELRVAANGHCYMELVEHDEHTGNILAKARANCWRNTYAFLRPRFERESGQRLQAGLRVLVQVKVEFHAQYGFSLLISDIDPSFSLGDAARRRQEILRQLEDDGVLNMNKGLELPCPVRHVAVVSSASAAGYGDFCDQLVQSKLPFVTKLFPAVMQGEQVEASVIEALNAVASDASTWDAVVIIRGGGAVTDLNGYESYALAANVAQFPLPVLTGIGHERDETVIDLVAHTRLKTPTAVAAFLIELWTGELDALNLIEQRLMRAVRNSLSDAALKIAELDKNITRSSTSLLRAAHRQLADSQVRLSAAIFQGFGSHRSRLQSLELHMASSVAACLEREKHRLKLAEKSLQMADPKHILRQGYSITLHDGKAVRSAADLPSGAQLTTLLADGEVKSTIV